MKHQPFEDWLLNNTPISSEQKRDLDLHLLTCSYCAALVQTDRVLHSMKMVSPAHGFTARFQIRLAAQNAVTRRKKILGSVLLLVLGMTMMGWIASPFLAAFLVSPATWITDLVEWGVFLLTTLQASAQAGAVLLDVMQGFLPPFAWLVMISAVAGIGLLWSVSIWRFVRVPQGV
jgi:hypothetical protein